jgi:hypothetical protein
MIMEKNRLTEELAIARSACNAADSIRDYDAAQAMALDMAHLYRRLHLIEQQEQAEKIGRIE